jgi:hypothetical protein
MISVTRARKRLEDSRKDCETVHKEKLRVEKICCKVRTD